MAVSQTASTPTNLSNGNNTTVPDISQFYKNVQNHGFSKNYNFFVESIEGLPTSPAWKQFNLYVQATKVPSRRINTTKVPYKAFEFVVPTNASYPDNESWDITFYSDDTFLIRDIFESWSKSVYDNNTNSSSYIDKLSTSIIKLNLLDNHNNIVRVYTLHGVFPVLVNAMEFNASDNGTEVSKVRVTLAFQYFTVEVPEVTEFKTRKQQDTKYFGPNTPNTQQAGGLLGALNNIAGIVNGVGGAAKALRNASKSIRGK